MTKIIDITSAANCASVTGESIVLDTNVWICIEGFDTAGLNFRNAKYSDAFAQLRKDNTIITNEYVVAEFVNRCLKIEYHQSKPEDRNGNIINFKKWRSSDGFQAIAEGVRDTMLNILDDCNFVPFASTNFQIVDVVKSACAGQMDITDLFLTSYCVENNFLIMTDDADYKNCGLTVLTANRNMLGR